MVLFDVTTDISKIPRINSYIAYYKIIYNKWYLCNYGTHQHKNVKYSL